MEHNEIITDELIAKYISGKTSEEEDQLIHDYLAQHPEFANDLLDIATALRHQRKHDESTGQVDQKQPQEAKRVAFIRRRTFYAIAASVAVLIVCVLMFHNEKEQTMVADADTEITNTNPINDGEGNDLIPTDITAIDLQPEEALLADNQENVTTPIQENTVPNQLQLEEPLLADNSPLDPQSQQRTDDMSSINETPIIASMTIYEGDDNNLLKENAVFITDSMPTLCNPNKPLVLKWTCNAPTLTLEFSTDDGETKIWNKTYDMSGKSNYSISTIQLENVFMPYNHKCFYWRMTAQYSDGKLVRQGTVSFVENK